MCWLNQGWSLWDRLYVWEKGCIMLSGALDRNLCPWQSIHCMCDEKGCILLSGTLDRNLCPRAIDTLYVWRNGLHIIIRRIGSKFVLHGHRYTVCVTKRAAYCNQAHWIEICAQWQPIPSTEILWGNILRFLLMFGSFDLRHTLW